VLLRDSRSEPTFRCGASDRNPLSPLLAVFAVWFRLLLFAMASIAVVTSALAPHVLALEASGLGCGALGVCLASRRLYFDLARWWHRVELEFAAPAATKGLQEGPFGEPFFRTADGDVYKIVPWELTPSGDDGELRERDIKYRFVEVPKGPQESVIHPSVQAVPCLKPPRFLVEIGVPDASTDGFVTAGNGMRVNDWLVTARHLFFSRGKVGFGVRDVFLHCGSTTARARLGEYIDLLEPGMTQESINGTFRDLVAYKLPQSVWAALGAKSLRVSDLSHCGEGPVELIGRPHGQLLITRGQMVRDEAMERASGLISYNANSVPCFSGTATLVKVGSAVKVNGLHIGAGAGVNHGVSMPGLRRLFNKIGFGSPEGTSVWRQVVTATPSLNNPFFTESRETARRQAEIEEALELAAEIEADKADALADREFYEQQSREGKAERQQWSQDQLSAWERQAFEEWADHVMDDGDRKYGYGDNIEDYKGGAKRERWSDLEDDPRWFNESLSPGSLKRASRLSHLRAALKVRQESPNKPDAQVLHDTALAYHARLLVAVSTLGPPACVSGLLRRDSAKLNLGVAWTSRCITHLSTLGMIAIHKIGNVEWIEPLRLEDVEGPVGAQTRRVWTALAEASVDTAAPEAASPSVAVPAAAPDLQAAAAAPSAPVPTAGADLTPPPQGLLPVAENPFEDFLSQNPQFELCEDGKAIRLAASAAAPVVIPALAPTAPVLQLGPAIPPSPVIPESVSSASSRAQQSAKDKLANAQRKHRGGKATAKRPFVAEAPSATPQVPLENQSPDRPFRDRKRFWANTRADARPPLPCGEVTADIQASMDDWMLNGSWRSLSRLRGVGAATLLKMDAMSSYRRYLEAGNLQFASTGETFPDATGRTFARQVGTCEAARGKTRAAKPLSAEFADLLRGIPWKGGSLFDHAGGFVAPPTGHGAVRTSLRAHSIVQAPGTWERFLQDPDIDRKVDDFFDLYPEALPPTFRSLDKSVQTYLDDMDGSKSAGWSSRYLPGPKNVWANNKNLTMYFVQARLALRLAEGDNIHFLVVEDMLRLGLRDPEEAFVKDEAHGASKTKSERWRLIWICSIIDSLCQDVLHRRQNKADIHAFSTGDLTAQAVGLGHDDDGIRRLGAAIDELAAGRDLKGSDVQCWDFSVCRDALYFDTERRVSRIPLYVHLGFEDCGIGSGAISSLPLVYPLDRHVSISADMLYAEAAVNSCHAIVVGSEIWSFDNFGLTASGVPSTSAQNSPIRSFTLAMAGATSQMAAGDDELHTGDVDARILEELGQRVKRGSETSSGPDGPVEFTSHTFTKVDGVWTASFENFPKMVAHMDLRRVPNAPPSQDMLAGMRFALRHTPLADAAFQTICSGMGWRLPDASDMRWD